jgi:hypothetical protein
VPAGPALPPPAAGLDFYSIQRYAPDPAEMEQFVQGFSWAPGCGLYFFSRPLLLFLGLLAVVLGFDGYLLYYLGRYAEAGDSGDHYFQVMLAADIATHCGLMVWSGKVARRLRWEQLRWPSFEEFRGNELRWNVVGGLAWGAGALGLFFLILLTVVALIVGASPPRGG